MRFSTFGVLSFDFIILFRQVSKAPIHLRYGALFGNENYLLELAEEDVVGDLDYELQELCSMDKLEVDLGHPRFRNAASCLLRAIALLGLRSYYEGDFLPGSGPLHLVMAPRVGNYG